MDSTAVIYSRAPVAALGEDGMFLKHTATSLATFFRKVEEGAKSTPPQIVLRRIRESGPVYTFFLILNHCIPENVFKFVRMSVREVRLTELDERDTCSAHTRWATRRDWALLRQAGYDESSLKHRFASSCRAVIYEENGELVGASWYAPLAMAQWAEYQASLDFPQPGIWNFDLWVLPSYRGKGVAGKILGFANSALYADGYRYVYGVIVKMNRNSLRANEKARSREIGHFLFMRILNFAFFRTQGTWHFGRFEEGRKFAVPLNRPNETEERPDEHPAALR